MTLALGQVDSGYALALAVVVAAIYIVLVRFLDLNEKEPLWAIGVAFAFGAVGAGAVHLLVDSTTLSLNFFWGPFWSETGRFLGLAAAVGVFTGISRWRGFSEFAGLLDGIVYGTAAGLGFATAEVLVRELSTSSSLIDGVTSSPGSDLWSALLTGLSDGMFGAIAGAFFGVAVISRHKSMRWVLPLAGFLAAVGAHVLYTELAQGDALAGGAATFRKWLALLLPLVALGVVAVMDLKRESEAIKTNLADEVAAGVVTQNEYEALTNLGRRRSEHMSHFFGFDFDGWAALRSLHNLQVQLALAKDRLHHETDPAGRAEIEAECAVLRGTIAQARELYVARRGRGNQGVTV